MGKPVVPAALGATRVVYLHTDTCGQVTTWVCPLMIGQQKHTTTDIKSHRVGALPSGDNFNPIPSDSGAQRPQLSLDVRRSCFPPSLSSIKDIAGHLFTQFPSPERSVTLFPKCPRASKKILTSHVIGCGAMLFSQVCPEKKT